MASSTPKSEAEKSGKKATKTLATSDVAKRKPKKNKTSNGVPSESRAPSSDSAATKTTPERKPKRERSVDDTDDPKAANKFPMERVRRIIRSEDPEIRVTNEAVFLVNKAAEKFLENFCGESHACCVQDRKKSLSYKHLASAVSKWKRYDFLSDFVPAKVKAEDALAEMKSIEPTT